MIFTWDNFEQFATQILAPGAKPEQKIVTDTGVNSSYHIEDDNGYQHFDFTELGKDIRVMVFSCLWHQPITFLVRDSNWIRFNFSLLIDIEMHAENQQPINTSQPSWRVINNPSDATVTEKIPQDTECSWVTICCKPSLIKALTGMTELPNLFEHDQLQTQGFHKDYNLSSRIHTITSDMVKNELSGALRLAYIEACAKQLLCLALNEVIALPAPKSEVIKLTEQDRVSLKQAQQILKEQFAKPPTVETLSKLVGINRNKLYYGFKEMFTTTMSEFIQKQRLENSMTLLLNTNISIQQIALEVGFRHQCNYTTAVKRYYGFTPKELRARKQQLQPIQLRK